MPTSSSSATSIEMPVVAPWPHSGWPNLIVQVLSAFRVRNESTCVRSGL